MEKRNLTRELRASSILVSVDNKLDDIRKGLATGELTETEAYKKAAVCKAVLSSVIGRLDSKELDRVALAIGTTR